MQQITISEAWVWVVGIAAAVVTLANAWKIISKVFHPEQDVREWTKQADKKLDRDDQRLKELEKSEKSNAEFQRVVSRVLIAQINHELSGNDVEHLRTARDELNDFLIGR